MSKHTARIAWACTAACLVAFLVAGMTGCPAGSGGGSPTPPFDAAGGYDGSWTPTTGLPLDCSLTLTIQHSPNALYPASFALAGSVRLPYTCLLGEELANLARLGATVLTVPLFGTLSPDQNGIIKLTFDSEALAEALGEEFNFVEGITLALTFDGTGQDTDDDGKMDTYTGDYSLSLTWETEHEGFENVQIGSEGIFDVSSP